MNKIYRQGDVVLVACDAPENIGKAKARGKIILALGEVTGHSHVVEGAVSQFVINGQRILWVEAPADLKHVTPSGAPTREHDWQVVEKGWYVVDTQRQYTAQAIVRVLD